MSHREIGLTARVLRSAGRWARLGSIALLLAACGGGGGGSGGGVEPPPAPPGGTGTGADSAAIFWTVYDLNVANGFAYSVQQTSDGGFVMAGTQASGFTGGTSNDFFMQKTTNLGVKQWSRRIPWTGNGLAYAVRQASDGGYMVAGTGGSLQNSAAVLIKLDTSGNPVAGWPKTYTPGGASAAFAMHAVNGGTDGYLVVGSADGGPGQGANVYVLRIDAIGSVLWQRADYTSFCADGSEEALAVTSTGDGNYVIAGRTGCLQWAGFLIKINGINGNEIWRKTFDGTSESQYASLNAVVATSGGELVMSGQVGSDCNAAVGGSCDALVIKTDNAGNELWRRIYGGAEKDGGTGVAIAADGSYLVAGSTRSYGGAIQDASQPYQWSDVMVIGVTASGATTWHKVKGQRPRGEDTANAIVRTGDGGFAIAGSCGGNVMLAKFDKNGDTVNLGPSYDLTINVPTAVGMVNFNNAVEVAGAGAASLLLPQELGGALADLLVAASGGAAPSTFCTGGGTYSFSPTVPATPATGSSYTLTFSNCVSGPAPDSIRINGTLTLTVDAASGTLSSGSYTLQVTAANVAVNVEEPNSAPLLGQSFSGGVRVARTATGGNLAETITLPSGVTLVITETVGGTPTFSLALTTVNVSYAVPTTGPITIGQPGDSVAVAAGGNTLTVGVLTSISVQPTTGEPIAGAYRVTAQDSSRLTTTLSGASALLAIDANGDGTDDGTISVPWDFIY